MDVVSSYLVVFQVSFFILHVQLGHINGQSLYETPRDDPLKDSEAHSYYRKVYERELLHENRINSLHKELEMIRDTCTTPDLQSTSPSYQIPSQNITRGKLKKIKYVFIAKQLQCT